MVVFRLRQTYLMGMKKILVSAFAILLAAFVVNTARSAPLEAFQWQKRVLMIFDQSRSSAKLDRQIDLLRDRRPDVKDRDMIVLVTAGNENSSVAMGYADLPSGAARVLRKQFAPSKRGLTMILVGKDGEEKRRWSSVTDPQEVFDTIDAMPMRKQEISEES